MGLTIFISVESMTHSSLPLFAPVWLYVLDVREFCLEAVADKDCDWLYKG